ncbi:hypothetical protein SERLA73DRAFT_67889 [Serpula lacrymans var. lacrymans S7.3]|uniref:Fungal-type protein kinase domain-containing protein n=2 Tax=Serpula lacrymans var. lacrymans TaxID=341189 RepID=F8PEW4_SERL3|nr:uncharacterized protein SERLADRAFT_431592 [Serpula lacrymans var. lacrymans S7.9]EGO04175.1 hypothetical protein SERLA73DRAFT_67889 [Serpula lacrymans var. lacrymans S7.3]EGO30119.1 hypothetical protein SERLADRAFT_431592 [Serpula lacrymans var. lacrymans S7.9]
MSGLGTSIPELPVKLFLDNAASQLKSINVANVKQELLDKGHIKDGRWAAFKSNPAKSQDNEEISFIPLTEVITHICECSGLCKTRKRTTYMDNLNSIPESVRSNLTRPDGCFVLYDSNKPPVPKGSNQNPTISWDDIAVAIEFKKKAGDDDIVILHHILRSDPCRRFAFGITVEANQMRFWFANRSTVFTTKPFDFITEHEFLIHCVLSFTYAEKADLGWDPTIKQQTDKLQLSTAQREFCLTLGLTRYVVEELESFKARRFNIQSGEVEGKPVAIKDAWVDEDRDREGDIRKTFEAEADDDDKGEIRKYFLTVLDHGDVIIDGHVDHTRDLHLRNVNIPSDSRFRLQRKELPADPVSSTGSAPSSGIPGQTRAPHAGHYQYSFKVHHRIVFEEVAQPIYTLKYLADVLRIMIHGTTSLQLLHKYGWVHRDVSTGNLLVYEGNGKMGDLEFTKKSDQESTHEIRTGTLNFMAVEVEAQRYNFKPSLADPLADAPTSRSAFRYNPLHDLESMWWIGVWMIFNHRDIEEMEDNIKEQIQQTQILFPEVLGGSTGRGLVLKTEDWLVECLWCLPRSFRGPVVCLSTIRKILVDHYNAAEAVHGKINPAAFKGIHSSFIEQLRYPMKEAGKTALYSLVDILVKKRTRGQFETSRDPPTGGYDRTSPTPQTKRQKTETVLVVDYEPPSSQRITPGNR